MKTRIYLQQITNADYSKEVFLLVPNSRRKFKPGDRFHIKSPLLQAVEVNRAARQGFYFVVAIPVPEKRRK